MPIKPDQFWEQPADGQVSSGLTKWQISDWEAQMGIALPRVLKPLFQVQMAVPFNTPIFKSSSACRTSVSRRNMG